MAKKKKARKKSRRRSVAQLEKLLAASEKRERALEKRQRALRKEIRGARKRKKKAVKKVKKVRPKKKELKSRGRDIRQKPRLAPTRDYRSGFKPFLEGVSKRPRGRHRSYAVVRVVLLDYADSPTRDLSILLGSKTATELKAMSNREILDRAPGSWGRLGPDSQVLFVAFLRGGKFRGKRKDPIRSKIARTNKRAAASIAAANIKRRKRGGEFHPIQR